MVELCAANGHAAISTALYLAQRGAFLNSYNFGGADQVSARCSKVVAVSSGIVLLFTVPMVLPPSQYQAARELDQICDLRVSIATGDYIDSDPWGRGKVTPARFPSRAAAERSLSALHQSTLAIAAPPAGSSASPRRALRPARLTRHSSASTSASPAPAPLPAPAGYPQPPQPPPHLQLRETSRDSGGAAGGDVTAPPPQRNLPHIPSGFVRDVAASSDKSSEPPSFANLRDLSMASTTFGRSSSSIRRPRGGGVVTVGDTNGEKRAAYADYLELSDEALVQRVFDDDNEPASVPGAGSVASVPQSPFNQNRLKRWISKKSSQNLDSAPTSRGSEGGDSLQRKSSAKKVRDSLSRLLALDSVGGKDDVYQPYTPPPGELGLSHIQAQAPISGRSIELASEDETPPPTAVYEMVTLKTNIPDRPRAGPATGAYEDALEFFDDVGDVAIGDGDVEDYEEEVIVRSNGRVRPQLKEHLITSIKSYHGPEDYDDDETSEDNESSTTTTEKSFAMINSTKQRRDGVFEQQAYRPQ